MEDSERRRRKHQGLWGTRLCCSPDTPHPTKAAGPTAPWRHSPGGTESQCPKPSPGPAGSHRGWQVGKAKSERGRGRRSYLRNDLDSERNLNLAIREILVQTPSLQLTSCATVVKAQNFYERSFLKGDRNAWCEEMSGRHSTWPSARLRSLVEREFPRGPVSLRKYVSAGLPGRPEA